MKTEEILSQIEAKKVDLNRLAALASGGDFVFFPPTNLRIQPIYPAELGFLKTVFWLYAHYSHNEGLSGVHFRFIEEQYRKSPRRQRYAAPETTPVDHSASPAAGGIDAVHLEPHSPRAVKTFEESIREHKILIGHLRKFFAHHLSQDKEGNGHSVDHCTEWFIEQCGEKEPGTDGSWEKLLVVLLSDCNMYFGRMLHIIETFAGDDDVFPILAGEWNRYYRNQYHYSDFVPICMEVVREFHLHEEFDCVRFCREGLSGWRRHLSRYDRLDAEKFREIARNLIRTHLAGSKIPLPYSPAEISEASGCPVTSPAFRKVYTQAVDLFNYSGPLSREDFFARFSVSLRGNPV